MSEGLRGRGVRQVRLTHCTTSLLFVLFCCDGIVVYFYYIIIASIRNSICNQCIEDYRLESIVEASISKKKAFS